LPFRTIGSINKVSPTIAFFLMVVSLIERLMLLQLRKRRSRCLLMGSSCCKGGEIRVGRARVHRSPTTAAGCERGGRRSRAGRRGGETELREVEAAHAAAREALLVLLVHVGSLHHRHRHGGVGGGCLLRRRDSKEDTVRFGEDIKESAAKIMWDRRTGCSAASRNGRKL